MRKTTQYTRFDFTDPNYPLGRIKEGESDGTEVNEAVFGDIQQAMLFFLRTLYPEETDPSVIGNGLADNDNNGYELVDAIRRGVREDTDWADITEFAGDNTQNTNPLSFNLQCRKINSRVEIFGEMFNDTGNGFVLPVGFRPSKRIDYFADNGQGEMLSIEASGAVFVAGGAIDSRTWYLNCSFPLL